MCTSADCIILLCWKNPVLYYVGIYTCSEFRRCNLAMLPYGYSSPSGKWIRGGKSNSRSVRTECNRTCRSCSRVRPLLLRIVNIYGKKRNKNHDYYTYKLYVRFFTNRLYNTVTNETRWQWLCLYSVPPRSTTYVGRSKKKPLLLKGLPQK